MTSEGEAVKLAEEHWGYIESLLKIHGEDEAIIEKIGFHYKQAMKHGFKHGRSINQNVKKIQEPDLPQQKISSEIPVEDPHAVTQNIHEESNLPHVTLVPVEHQESNPQEVNSQPEEPLETSIRHIICGQPRCLNEQTKYCFYCTCNKNHIVKQNMIGVQNKNYFKPNKQDAPVPAEHEENEPLNNQKKN